VIAPLLRDDHRETNGVPWRLAVFALNDLEAAAAKVASHVASLRMAGTPQFLAAWNLAQAGTPYTAAQRRAISAFLSRGLGRPGQPTSDDHLQGMVAEHLWHIYQTEIPPDIPVLFVSSPKFDPTAPGADGLVIFGDPARRFRVWEVKKAGSVVSSTIAKSYRQLSRRGDEYVAQLTAIAQESGDPSLATVFAQLLDWWIDGSSEATAGVAITSPASPNSCFSTMRQRLAGLSAPDAHLGLIISIPAYLEFCSRVREILWTGL